MLNQETLDVVTSYWSTDMGCSAESLFAQPLQVLIHGPALADYTGGFALFRDGMTTASFPPRAIDALRGLLPSPPFTPRQFADAFLTGGFKVIGPACLAYGEHIVTPRHDVRLLSGRDQNSVHQLRAACDAKEWEHGGCDAEARGVSGVFVDDELVSLAGFEIWGRKIAHISVVTHPSHRSRGYARSAVAHVSKVALEAGLIPQYRALESNEPSICVARSLGFVHYASSVAVKLDARPPESPPLD